MKRKLILSFGVAALLGMGGYLIVMDQKSQKEIVPQPPIKQETKTTDAVAYMIESASRPGKGIEIDPIKTDELKAWFAESTEQSVPRVFVKKLPSDFATEGNKDLFAQIISALILRRNEQTIKERVILILLKDKLDKHENWNEVETAYFDSLVEKYDSKYKREVSAQLSDLLNKVDIIPPMMAVAQAAYATDWGKVNLDAPFGQTGWLDNKTYSAIKFDSLPKALDSYVNEMNGLPSLADWRFSRSNLRGRHFTDVGQRVLKWLGEYQPEDAQYAQKIQDKVQELGYEIPDNFSFIKQISFDKGKAAIQTQGREIPLAIEIAKTPEQQQRGLMFRGNLPEGTGMMFLNETEKPYSMWMKNTYIPLDIIYFDKSGQIQTIIENAEPLTLISRPSVVPVLGAIELPAGFVQKHGIKVGDKVKF